MEIDWPLQLFVSNLRETNVTRKKYVKSCFSGFAAFSRSCKYCYVLNHLARLIKFWTARQSYDSVMNVDTWHFCFSWITCCVLKILKMVHGHCYTYTDMLNISRSFYLGTKLLWNNYRLVCSNQRIIFV